MSEKKRFFVLLAILAISLGLMIYAKTHIGPDFIRQL